MQTKVRLERVLQILADVERAGAFSDIERDIVLNELREAYLEVRFADKVERVEPKSEVAAPILPAEEEDEPEVEVELLFSEEEEADEEAEAEEPIVAPEPIVATEPVTEPEPIAEPVPVSEPEPVVAPEVAVEDAASVAPEVAVEESLSTLDSRLSTNETLDSRLSTKEEEYLSSLNSQLSTPKRSAILSLYDDEPKAVVGELFAEQPSVADVIARPKAVAESTHVESLRGVIGVADRFMLIRELFDGDAEAYNNAIDSLDAQPSFDDCIIYISEHFSWRAEREGTKYMMELLQRKFNNR